MIKSICKWIIGIYPTLFVTDEGSGFYLFQHNDKCMFINIDDNGVLHVDTIKDDYNIPLSDPELFDKLSQIIFNDL